MSKGTHADGLIIAKYADDFDITETTARIHRRKQNAQWVAWCKKNGFNGNYQADVEEIKQEMNNVMETETNNNLSLVERYKMLEGTAFNQLRKTQLLLDDAINEQQFQTLRIYVGGVKDLTSTFNELCRLRQIAEVQEGNFLPMAIFERYKTEFYPRLNSGVDELKIAIENALPSECVPEFQRAWHKCYYRWKDAAKEAENALNDYKELAQLEALSSLDKKENKKEKNKVATRSKIKNKK